MEFRDLKKQYMHLRLEIDKAIADVLQSSRFIMGAPVTELEEQLADYVGVKHCISCANGTDALQLALMVWNVGPGDAVFVPDFTFFSTAEVVALQRAHPVFVDIDPRTFNMDPDSLEKAIQATLEDGRYKAKVVITVDLFGQSADYNSLRSICDKYNLLLLEDAAQGFGGSQQGKMNCSFGDISTTSFFPSKPLGGYGDGGAIFTDQDDIADTLQSLRIHGKGKHKYDNVRIGMNSRLDTIQAAILKVKLKAFKDYEINAVNKSALYYSELLKDTVVTPFVKEGNRSSWAQYSILLESSEQRAFLQQQLQKHDIPTMIFYNKPLHLQSAFSDSIADCPVTEDICNRVLSLPMHPYLAEDNIQHISNLIMTSLNQ